MIYPVDVDGLCAGCSPGQASWMDGVAALTGGVAYYSGKDPDVAIREAMDDGRVGYMLGFYQSDADRASQVHRIAVRVNRPGVRLRYRSRYQTEAPRTVSANSKADLAQALNRPLDAAWRFHRSVGNAGPRPPEPACGGRRGKPGSGAERGPLGGHDRNCGRFTAVDGKPAGEVVSQTLSLDLRQTTYDLVLQQGIAYHNVLKIPPKAVELKLLFANSGLRENRYPDHSTVRGRGKPAKCEVRQSFGSQARKISDP